MSQIANSPTDQTLHLQRALIQPPDLRSVVRSNCNVLKITLFSNLNISEQFRSGAHIFLSVSRIKIRKIPL